MEKLIIGITGQLGAGKDTAARHLVTKGFKHVSLSQIIRTEARKRKLTINRATLIRLGNQLRREHGRPVLARLAMEQSGNERNVVVTSIRNIAEVEHLRKSGKFVLVRMTADPEVRLKRLRKRGRGDETTLTLVELRRREQAEEGGDPTAQQVHKVQQLADKVIEDNGTKEALYQKLDSLLNQIT